MMDTVSCKDRFLIYWKLEARINGRLRRTGSIYVGDWAENGWITAMPVKGIYDGSMYLFDIELTELGQSVLEFDKL